MKELTLLVDKTTFPPEFQDGTPTDVAHWNSWDVPEGEFSIPSLMHGQLMAIRDEHMRWAYDMGRMAISGWQLQTHLKAGETLSMWWCSLLYERHPKMTPALYDVYKLRALEKLLDEGKYTILRLSGGDARLRHTLALYCRATGRMFVEFHDPNQPREEKSRLRRIYDACPAVLRVVARYAHWWWNVRRHLPYVAGSRNYSLPAAPGKSATIATYFPNIDMNAAKDGRFRSRYWETLHDVLNPDANTPDRPWVRWLFVRFPSPEISFKDCIRLRKRFQQQQKDGVSFHYLEEFISFRDLVAAWRRHLRLTWRSFRLERYVRPAFHFAGSRMNFWDYLKDDWAESFRGWRGLERCLQYRGIRNYIRLAGMQEWYAFPLENCPWERMFTHGAHEARDLNGSGPVYGAQHSTIRPTDFRYFDDPRTFVASDCDLFQPDKVCANGSGAGRQWRNNGLPEERLEVVEALRYIYLADEKPLPATDEKPRRLLVVTSFFEDETRDHLRLLGRALEKGLLDDYDVVIKPHPYLSVTTMLQELLGDKAGKVSVVDGRIEDQLVSGTQVWASNSTTVALEATLRGLPVMVMWPDDNFDLCPLQDVEGLQRTGSLKDVQAALADPRVLQLPASYMELDRDLPRWRKLLEPHHDRA